MRRTSNILSGGGSLASLEPCNSISIDLLYKTNGFGIDRENT